MLQYHKRERCVSPTIRIDDEVWGWLKSLAVPFEDTPNSVLRRVAGIDAVGAAPANFTFTPPRVHDLRVSGPTKRDEVAGPVPPGGRRVTGEWLNKTFHLHAAHALYHKDGLLYERLTQFPGVLCDARGWVRFATAAELAADPLITVGTKLNVEGGLAKHPRYQEFPRSER
jgi:hypothetical protein